MRGDLACNRCRREYPIVNGIPRFFPGGQTPGDVQNTVDGFGYEWEKFTPDILGTYMDNQENFYDFIYPVTKDFFQGKIVLDAGCGMGRFLKLGAEFGSQEIIGLDLSNSVEAAYHNTSHLPNTHVVQGDILALPLKPRFDYIFSIGVLQFLSQPQRGFKELTQLLKPGGKISIWVYSEENNGWVIRFLSPIREKITSRLPRPVLLMISRLLGLVLYSTLRLIYKPANEWSWLKPIGRKLPYNEYLYYSSRLPFSGVVSVIFDHLVPQLVVYLSRDEIRDWFENENLRGVEISSRNNMSWRAHGIV